MESVGSGAAWPSSARALRRSINFFNGRNPFFVFVFFSVLVFLLFTMMLFFCSFLNTSRYCL